MACAVIACCVSSHAVSSSLLPLATARHYSPAIGMAPWLLLATMPPSMLGQWLLVHTHAHPSAFAREKKAGGANTPREPKTGRLLHWCFPHHVPDSVASLFCSLSGTTGQHGSAARKRNSSVRTAARVQEPVPVWARRVRADARCAGQPVCQVHLLARVPRHLL